MKFCELKKRSMKFRILDKNSPNYRKAYSDRTAWLMASLSELVYEDFEKRKSNKQHRFFKNEVRKNL